MACDRVGRSSRRSTANSVCRCATDDGELNELGRKRQLEKAILYDPLDQAAHEALGHKGWENNGVTYYGTDERDRLHEEA